MKFSGAASYNPNPTADPRATTTVSTPQGIVKTIGIDVGKIGNGVSEPVSFHITHIWRRGYR